MSRPAALIALTTLAALLPACRASESVEADAAPVAQPTVDAGATPPTGGTPTDAGPGDATPAPDAAPVPPVDRGPTTIPVDGDPNGLFWDAPTATLYVADDNGNRLLAWTDASGFGEALALPAAPADGPGLGQVVRTPDGTLVVTRFGFGSAGDVVFVSADGTPGVVPGLDPERRRIGLTVTDDGTLYDGWFARLATGERVGSVGRLSLAGGEPEVLTGLKKLVGVLVMGDALYVSDQELGQILEAPLADPSNFSVHATLLNPDLLAAGPEGSLFTGADGGLLYRIHADGTAEAIDTDYQQVRGVAYDADHRRLFVVDHDADESDGVAHALRIVPVE